MNPPNINHSLELGEIATAPAKTEPAKKPSATKQQAKAAYLMVLIALTDSLKTSTQTAQIQAKVENSAINEQQSLMSKMQAVKSVRVANGNVFNKDHYWEIQFYTCSGFANHNHHWHTIVEPGAVDHKWLTQRFGQDVGQSIRQHQIAKYTWVEKKAGQGTLRKAQISMEGSGETRTILEGQLNLGMQKTETISAGMNATAQSLQQVIGELGNVSQQLRAFSSRIASI